jgi:hypothetical protein
VKWLQRFPTWRTNSLTSSADPHNDLAAEGTRWLNDTKYRSAVFDGNNIAGLCEDVNGLWVAHIIINDKALRVDLVDYVAEQGCEAPEGYSHTVALVDDEIWDWSYRQINENAEVPVRVPVQEWEQTWGVVKRAHITLQDAQEIIRDWQ